jgi:hypothetical protein
VKRESNWPVGIRVVLFCVLLTLPRTARASVIVVGDDTPAGCTASAFQDALAAAAVPDPDYTIIRFDCGAEPLTIRMPDVRVTIPDRTTIDGGDRVTILGLFSVAPDSAVSIVRLGLGGIGPVINNFGTLEVRGSTFMSFGHGIVNREGSVTVTDTLFMGARRYYGGGISSSGTLRVDHSTFDGNQLEGAIDARGVLDVRNSIFRNNSGENLAGGIQGSGDWLIQNCEFTGNGGSRFGGAIFHGAGELTIKNSQFVGNGAQFGGAITERGSLIVENSEFRDNQATISGGAIYNTGPLLSLVNSTVTGNTCRVTCGPLNAGGGIWSTTEPVLKHTTVSGNVPDDVFVKP